MTILIVGGDSQLSNEFCKLDMDDDIILTTRRPEKLKQKNYVYLDLLSVDDFNIPSGVDRVIIMGGVTTYDNCMDKSDYAYNVNCISIPKLVYKLLDNNVFTCFVSSNTVFKSEDKIPNEKDVPNPGFAYAEMKYKTESEIIKISTNLNKQYLLSIFRMTKNVNCYTKPFNQWLSDIVNSREIVAFRDLFFSPIRFKDSASTILKIINDRLSGVYHLSGEKDISYYDFAVELVNYLGKNNNVKSVLSTDIGVNLVYNHKITSLSMEYSYESLGVSEIKLDEIYSYFNQCLVNR
ncbi:sugar nucleotide-binding protein [bacterium]|jgi:dTDP-4-dehydrorhamnose reductase|nr:sugar nucleotide-binding protein [bacterium]